MSNPEIDDHFVSLRERIGQPFRVLFQEGFRSAWRKHTLFSMISLSLLCVAVASGIWWFGLRDGSPEDTMADGSGSSKTGLAAPRIDLEKVAEQLRMDEAQWEDSQKEGRRQEEIALAKYDLVCARQLANRTQEAIDACRDAAGEWAGDLKDFEDSPIDWSEASNRELLGQVDVLLSLETPSKVEADDLLEQYKALTAPLDRADTLDDVTTISSDLESKIKELKETARSMQDLYGRRRAMLRSIRDTAKASSQKDLPNVRVAIDARRAELAQEQQSRIQDQLVEVRQENEAVLLKAKEAATNALAEAKKKAAETEGRIATERVEFEVRRREVLQTVADAEDQLKADREKLEREFQMDLPKIKHYLMVFITPDNHHPLKKMTIEEMPFPYSYIESFGALVQTDKGLNMLGNIASERAGKRPRGPLPFVVYDDNWRFIEEDERQPIVIAQQLLCKYGHLMVEKKMLLP